MMTDGAITEILTSHAEREKVSEGDALRIEGDVLRVCFRALTKIHESRRPAIVGYIADRFGKTNYLDLLAQLAESLTEMKKENDELKATINRAANG